MKKRLLRAVCLLAGFALCFARLTAAGAAGKIAENEWGFVDVSLDSSGGIPGDAAGVMDRIRRTGVLRVATEPYFAPQEFIDPDLEGSEQYVGADMELARRIAERMGVRLEIVPMDFSRVLPALAEDLCDLTISALAFTPARASGYTMSKGYYYTESRASTTLIIREEDREEITSVAALEGRDLIAQTSSLQESIAARNIFNYREFRRVDSVQTVYEAVKNREADAGVVDVETAKEWIRSNPDAGLVLVENVTYFLDEEYLGDRIAARKGELQLIAFVNGVIDEVTENGLYEKWLRDARNRAAELGL